MDGMQMNGKYSIKHCERQNARSAIDRRNTDTTQKNVYISFEVVQFAQNDSQFLSKRRSLNVFLEM